MIRNWIIIAWRNIQRQAATTILNTGGLALGITGSIVIFILISFLTGIDTFHTNYEHIHRVVVESVRNGEHYHTSGVPNPLPDAFREDFPEIRVSTFMSHEYRGVLLGVHEPNQEKRYIEQLEGVGYAENDFFKIFDRKLLQGNVNEVLKKPHEVVVSTELAKKLFPDGSAIGKQIEVNKDQSMIITGVMEDFSTNTDFPFHMFISFSTVKDEFVSRGWGSTSSNDQFYLLLPENMDVQSVNERLIAFDEKHFGDNEKEKIIHTLQPLKNIHFDPKYVNYSYRSIQRSNLYVMGLVGFFLILTGCINYINLSTAVALKRAREVGIRKVLGGSRGVIIRQFLSETFIVTLIAIIIALGLAEFLLRFINQLLESELSLNLFNNPQLWIFLISLLILITIMAGLYPAFVLSGFQPARVLKRMVASKSSAGYQLRRGLVIFQFFISQVFIIGTVILLLQMQFVSNKDLGFTTESIVNITLPLQDVDKARAFRDKVQSSSSIDGVTLAGSSPASGSVSMTTFDYEGEEYLTMMKAGDENYIPFFKLQLLSGRSLSPSDSMKEVVANEQFLREAGFTDPEAAIGKFIKVWDREVPVVGVVKDFHSMSLREKIRPLLFYSDIENYGYLSAKIHSKNVPQTIKSLEGIYKEIYPEYAMEYEFFEDDISNFYQGERRMISLLALFAVFAIVIGCIGLYGLVSYVTQQKVKEIGIRKVLGASVAQILGLFSKEVIILICIAFAIAAPLAGWGMTQWLNNFQYRIELGFPIYLTGIVVTLVIAVATVGIKTFNAATANPVDSLINE